MPASRLAADPGSGRSAALAASWRPQGLKQRLHLQQVPVQLLLGIGLSRPVNACLPARQAGWRTAARPAGCRRRPAPAGRSRCAGSPRPQASSRQQLAGDAPGGLRVPLHGGAERPCHLPVRAAVRTLRTCVDHEAREVLVAVPQHPCSIGASIQLVVRGSTSCGPGQTEEEPGDGGIRQVAARRFGSGAEGASCGEAREPDDGRHRHATPERSRPPRPSRCGRRWTAAGWPPSWQAASAARSASTPAAAPCTPRTTRSTGICPSGW